MQWQLFPHRLSNTVLMVLKKAHFASLLMSLKKDNYKQHYGKIFKIIYDFQ